MGWGWGAPHAPSRANPGGSDIKACNRFGKLDAKILENHNVFCEQKKCKKLLFNKKN